MKGKLNKAQRKEWFWAVIFLLPLTVGLLLFCVYPLVTGITYSFTAYNLFEMHFVGLENYKKVFLDSTFWRSFLNVIIFSINVPVNLVLALITSAVLNSKIRGSKIYRSIFFLPISISSIADFTSSMVLQTRRKSKTLNPFFFKKSKISSCEENSPSLM